VRLFNRYGTELKPDFLRGVAYAKLYCKGGYDSATGRQAYKKYPLAEIFKSTTKS